MQITEPDISRRSRWLDRLALAILACLLFALAAEAAAVFRHARYGPDLWNWIAYRLPMAFYLSAIWTMHRAFARFAAGELFDQVLPPSLTRLGLALAGGAATSVLITPICLRLIGGPRHGAFAAFDPPAITVGLVGLLLVVLADLFSRAGAMRRELDEIL